MNIEPANMMNRLPQQFFVNLVNNIKRLEEKGHDVIKLAQGNPDGKTPENIVKALQQAVVKPIYHGYSPFSGYSFLKEAVSQFYLREYGVVIDPEQEVSILFGSKTGLVEISQCLLNPGDVALVPDPGYPDYLSGIAIAGAQMMRMGLTEENGFLPNYKTLDKKVLHKAKMMFLNYPNNPTGAIATEQFFKETVEVAKQHQITIIHDFAYGAIGFDGNRPISFMQTPGAKEVGIEFYTLSKTYNMAGWRVGFAVGNPQIIRLLNLINDHYYVSLFGAIQEAATEALTGPQDSVKQQIQRYEKRRNVFYEAIQQIGWNAKPTAGSFFAWLPVPNGLTSMPFTDLLLNEAHVAVAPGLGFGDYGDSYVRIGLLADENRLLEAVERIQMLRLFD